MVPGTWFVARGSWYVVRFHSSLFMAHGSSFVVRGSWLVVHGSWFVNSGSSSSVGAVYDRLEVQLGVLEEVFGVRIGRYFLVVRMY